MLDNQEAFQPLQSSNKLAMVVSVEPPDEPPNCREGLPEDTLELARIVPSLGQHIPQQRPFNLVARRTRVAGARAINQIDAKRHAPVNKELV